MKENEKYLNYISDAEFDKLDFTISLEDMLLDLKVLLKEYYCGTFANEGKSLKITLNNGQRFLLNLKTV